MRCARLVVSMVLAGCARASQPPVQPSQIAWSEDLPIGYVVLGVATAECDARPSWGSLERAPATSLFCERAELQSSLIEQARQQGGTVLAQARCERTEPGPLSCSAVIARPGKGAAPPPRMATGSDAGDSDTLSPAAASRITIDLEPAVASFERRSRPGADVQEFAALPVGHVELGVMRARCTLDSCDAEQTRAGLRKAAGGLGVPDLVGVRCVALEGEHACVATLAASERDPETDPRAR